MKKFFVLLLILIFACSCKQTKKEEEKFLVVGIAPIIPPFAYIKDGSDGSEKNNHENIVGFDMELAKEIAATRGETLQIKTMYFSDIIPAVESGEIDIALCAITITDERKQLINFSLPYYEASQVVIIRKDDEEFEDITTKEELGRNKQIASLKGSTGAALAKSIARNREVVEVNSWQIAISHLLSNKVDAVIVDLGPAKVFLEQYEGKLDILEIEFEKESYGVAVGKKNRELLASVNETISRLINSGQYIEMVAKYINSYSAN